MLEFWERHLYNTKLLFQTANRNNTPIPKSRFVWHEISSSGEKLHKDDENRTILNENIAVPFVTKSPGFCRGE